MGLLYAVPTSRTINWQINTIRIRTSNISVSSQVTYCTSILLLIGIVKLAGKYKIIGQWAQILHRTWVKGLENDSLIQGKSHKDAKTEVPSHTNENNLAGKITKSLISKNTGPLELTCCFLISKISQRARYRCENSTSTWATLGTSGDIMVNEQD